MVGFYKFFTLKYVSMEKILILSFPVLLLGIVVFFWATKPKVGKILPKEQIKQ